MAISPKTLTEEVKRKFPRINKPQDYANLILKGIELKARNRDTAKRRRDFLKNSKVKTNAFVKSYASINLLSVIRNAEQNSVIASSQHGFLYSFTTATRILTVQQNLLFKHIDHDYHVKTIVIKTLKLTVGSSITAIKNKMNQGNLFHRVSTYEKVFSDLGKNGIGRKRYTWMGVRTRPLNHYYLSTTSHNIISNCNREVKSYKNIFKS